MNGATNHGLKNGRDWTVMPADGEAYEWSIDPAQGLIQGPLDLEFLRGHRVALNLGEGQIALLVEGRLLQAVFLDGGHVLDIGGGDGQIPPECKLVFMAQTRGLDVSWSRSEPLDLEHEAEVIGRCTLAVSGPRRFYETFLAGLEAWDEPFLMRLMRQTVQAALADVLDGADPDPGPAADPPDGPRPGRAERRAGPLRPVLRGRRVLHRVAAGGGRHGRRDWTIQGGAA